MGLRDIKTSSFEDKPKGAVGFNIKRERKKVTDKIENWLSVERDNKPLGTNAQGNQKRLHTTFYRSTQGNWNIWLKCGRNTIMRCVAGGVSSKEVAIREVEAAIIDINNDEMDDKIKNPPPDLND